MKPALKICCSLQALFCQVPQHHVLNMFDVSNIWHVPLVLEAQGAHSSICNALQLGGAEKMNLSFWRQSLAERWDNLAAAVRANLLCTNRKRCLWSGLPHT